MILIGDRIKQRRTMLHMNQEDLANKLGSQAEYKKSAISKIENNKNDISRSKISEFAKALNTTEAYLMGWIDDPDITYNDLMGTLLRKTNKEDTIELPILREIATPMDTYIFDNRKTLSSERIPISWITDASPHALLRVQGDSMSPKFEEGDLLLVCQQDTVESGSYAVVLVDNDVAIIRRIVYDKNSIELQSINPMYVSRRFEGQEMNRVKIFGMVTLCIRACI